MLKIRLSRIGKSNSPIFRLVVAEKTRAVKRENLEILGLYNPTKPDNKFSANKERVLFWISKGAQPSETVNNLLCDFDILPKKDKLNIVHGKSIKKKAAKEAEGKKPEAAVKEDSTAEEGVEPSKSDNPEPDEKKPEVVEEPAAEEIKEEAVAPEVKEKPQEVTTKEKPTEVSVERVASNKEKSE